MTNWRLWSCCAALLLMLPMQMAYAERYALVVAVESYGRGQFLPTLQRAPTDGLALVETLREADYQVEFLGGSGDKKPTHAAIRKGLDELLEKVKGPQDLLMIAFIGHGVQFATAAGEQKYYLCPSDAKVSRIQSGVDITDENRLFELDTLLVELQANPANAKLLVLDTCRLDPTKRTNRRSPLSTIRPNLPTPAAGVVLLTSCEEDQQSLEDNQLQGGLFMQYFVKGLKGAADAAAVGQPGDKLIQLRELYEYTSKKTMDHVKLTFGQLEQKPEQLGQFLEDQPLADYSIAANAALAAQADAAMQAAQQANQLSQDLANRMNSGNRGGAPTQPNRGQEPDSPEGIDPEQPTNRNSLGTLLVRIPAGSFRMGSPSTEIGRNADESQVEVRITKDYLLGQHELTKDEWTQVMGTTPWKKSKKDVDSSTPATHISWEDANEFCRKLTELERAGGFIQADWMYDLPTEAEWELACRATAETAYSFGDSEAELEGYAWYAANAASEGKPGVHIVGALEPNNFTLFDMHGNVAELCADAYKSQLPGGTDPLVVDEQAPRVLRGGSWENSAQACRSAYRGAASKTQTSAAIGFRLCLRPIFVGN